jgi:hypothetical protein
LHFEQSNPAFLVACINIHDKTFDPITVATFLLFPVEVGFPHFTKLSNFITVTPCQNLFTQIQVNRSCFRVHGI